MICHGSVTQYHLLLVYWDAKQTTQWPFATFEANLSNKVCCEAWNKDFIFTVKIRETNLV